MWLAPIFLTISQNISSSSPPFIKIVFPKLTVYFPDSLLPPTRTYKIPLLKNYGKSHSALWSLSWLLPPFFLSVHVYWVSVCGPCSRSCGDINEQKDSVATLLKQGPIPEGSREGTTKFFLLWHYFSSDDVLSFLRDSKFPEDKSQEIVGCIPTPHV